MIEIPLSVIGSPDAFRAALETHRADLADHRLGEPGQPVPIAHELLESLILRIPDTGPVAERGPDRFEIADYVIVDDRPPDPPPPTLAQRKEVLLFDLHNAAQAAIDKALSPARARLLNVEYADASVKVKNRRSSADKATIKKFMAFSDRTAAVNRIVARAAVAIDDLTENDINDWTVPTFD